MNPTKRLTLSLFIALFVTIASLILTFGIGWVIDVVTQRPEHGAAVILVIVAFTLFFGAAYHRLGGDNQ